MLPLCSGTQKHPSLDRKPAGTAKPKISGRNGSWRRRLSAQSWPEETASTGDISSGDGGERRRPANGERGVLMAWRQAASWCLCFNNRSKGREICGGISRRTKSASRIPGKKFKTERMNGMAEEAAKDVSSAKAIKAWQRKAVKQNGAEAKAIENGVMKMSMKSMSGRKEMA